MIAFILILILSKSINAKIMIDEESTILPNYVNYVFENQTRKSQGYVGLIINDNDNQCIEKSLINIHLSQTNSFFLINFNHFDRDIEKIKKVCINTINFYFIIY